MVRFIDDGVGQYRCAGTHGPARDTVVVFCSDHGDFSGEHGMQCKGGVFYDALTRVPLTLLARPHSAERHRPQHGEPGRHRAHLDGLARAGRTQGNARRALPTVTAAEPRIATFSEYGAGGPPFRQNNLEMLPQPWGRSALIDTSALAGGRGQAQDGAYGRVEVYPRSHGRQRRGSDDLVNDRW